MIKIIAVDDSKEYLQSLEQLFSPHSNRYHLAKSISEMKDEYNIEYLLKQIKEIQPHVVLMDLSFAIYNKPHDYGIELVRRILLKHPDQKIIMLVGDDNDDDQIRWEKIRRSFEVGAMAYLAKRDIALWMVAINEVVNGDSYASQSTLKTIIKNIRGKNKNAFSTYKLGKRQLEVLTHLSKDKTLQQVADSIRGENGKSITIHTVNFHLRNIRAQFNANTLHGVVAKAIRENLID